MKWFVSTGGKRRVADTGKTTLLVVDDESSVCRAVRRLLRDKFDEILTVETPADAEAVLASRQVTHLVCDQCLGPGQPEGLAVASGWRATYPSIRKLVILTGADVKNLTALPGVDLVLPKTTDPVDLAALLVG
jgi:DNA-binding NtrC family response regulator